jgi:hypothetical protein
MNENDEIEFTINLGIFSAKLKQSHLKKLQSMAANGIAEFVQSIKTVRGCYYIIAKHSGKCLDVEGMSKERGTRIQQWNCGKTENQQWFLINAGRKYYYIISKNSGFSLDIDGASKEAGAKLIQWTFHGEHHQQWELRDAGEGYYIIVARHSGKCLDVEGYNTNDGAKVQQWTLNPSDNQKWQLKPVE